MPAQDIPTPEMLVRPRHQAAMPNGRIADFEHTQFPCFVKDIRMGRNGTIEIALQVPFKHRDLAMQLTDAYGMALSGDFVKYGVDTIGEDDNAD